jgi:hypothetical protein
MSWLIRKLPPRIKRGRKIPEQKIEVSICFKRGFMWIYAVSIENIIYRWWIYLDFPLPRVIKEG